MQATSNSPLQAAEVAALDEDMGYASKHKKVLAELPPSEQLPRSKGRGTLGAGRGNGKGAGKPAGTPQGVTMTRGASACQTRAAGRVKKSKATEAHD